jgi:hypothetical protein
MQRVRRRFLVPFEHYNSIRFISELTKHLIKPVGKEKEDKSDRIENGNARAVHEYHEESCEKL